jgi:hypothetical protein
MNADGNDGAHQEQLGNISGVQLYTISIELSNSCSGTFESNACIIKSTNMFANLLLCSVLGAFADVYDHLRHREQKIRNTHFSQKTRRLLR